MRRFLPFFPLSIVVFPGEVVKLHVFEPRYRQLINEVVKEERTFGIPVVLDKKAADIATEVQVVSIDRRYEKGDLDIRVRGLRKVMVHRYFHKMPDRLYPGGEVEGIADILDSDELLQEKVFALLSKIHEILGIQQPLMVDAVDIAAYKVGHNVGFSLAQEYELLKLPTELARLKMIHSHLEMLLPMVIRTEQLKARARLNGHYKNLIPPDVM